MAEMRFHVLEERRLTGDPVADVCRRRGVSQSSFYEWQSRYRRHGLAGLEAMSRRPHHTPAKVADDLENRVVALRQQHGWGARTIRSYLRRAGIDKVPAISTIHRVLQRAGLVAREPKKRHHKKFRRFERDDPNDLRQIDATQVELTDGSVVWVIDCLDDHSRYLLAAIAVSRLTSDNAVACIEGGFASGAPREVLSDNGTCFTGRLLFGAEVEFERRLKELGINHIKTTPGHPETIGKIERLHLTLKRWLAAQPPPATIVELQGLLDVFRHHYNDERPHQGIDDATPAERYGPTRKPVHGRITGVTARAPRRVPVTGQISFEGRIFYVGRRHFGATVDVERSADEVTISLHGAVLIKEILLPGQRYYGPRPARR